MTTPADLLLQIVPRLDRVIAGAEAKATSDLMLVAGTIDDPDSFDVAGGKTGPLGYYPFVDGSGITRFFPCLARMKADANDGIADKVDSTPIVDAFAATGALPVASGTDGAAPRGAGDVRWDQVALEGRLYDGARPGGWRVIPDAKVTPADQQVAIFGYDPGAGTLAARSMPATGSADRLVANYGTHFIMKDQGSGLAAGPHRAAFAAIFVYHKTDFLLNETPGEGDPVFFIGRQGIGDCCAWLADVAGRHGFYGAYETVTSSIRSDGSVIKAVGLQAGIVDTVLGAEYGHLVIARANGGSFKAAFQAQSEDGSTWIDFLVHAHRGIVNFRVGGDGAMQLGTGANGMTWIYDPSGFADRRTKDGNPIERMRHTSTSFNSPVAIGKIGEPTATLDVAGNAQIAGSAQISGDVSIRTGTDTTATLSIASGRVVDGDALLDLYGQAGAGFGARLHRASGATGNTSLIHRGTGGLIINASEGSVLLQAGSETYITLAGGAVAFGKPRIDPERLVSTLPYAAASTGQCFCVTDRGYRTARAGGGKWYFEDGSEVA